MSATTDSATSKEPLIRITAYLLWEQAGYPDGRSEEFWFEAERTLVEPKSTTTVEPPKSAEPTSDAKKAA